jgi:hypothetical protein
VANYYQNQDLYWALRGGGGGTFGVVVSVTLKTFPDPPVIVQNFSITFPDVTSLWNLSAAYLTILPQVPDNGGSAYYYFDPYGKLHGDGKPFMIALHYFFNQTNVTAINNIFEPLYEIAHTLGQATVANASSSFPRARVIFPQPGGSDVTGSNIVIGARMFSRNLVEEEGGPSRLVSALHNITLFYPSIIMGYQVAGGQVALNAGVVNSSLNPSWRQALGQHIVHVGWSDQTSFSVQQQLQTYLTDIMVPQLAAIDPDMGAYTNEANPNEPEWQSVFWGSNYPGLLEVKNKWDPAGLFRCNRCVGSERWDGTGNCPANATTTGTANGTAVSGATDGMRRSISIRLLMSAVAMTVLFWSST